MLLAGFSDIGATNKGHWSFLESFGQHEEHCHHHKCHMDGATHSTGAPVAAMPQ